MRKAFLFVALLAAASCGGSASPSAASPSASVPAATIAVAQNTKLGQILVDGMFKGKMRKMVLHADRNGYFYVLDRLSGEHLLTSKFAASANWASGINAKGQPARILAKDSTVPGSLVSPNNSGATNWQPPSYSPDTGLMYVQTNEAYAMYYLTETDPRGAMGLGGKEEVGLGSLGAFLTAIDYKTGKTVWRHRYPGLGGNISNGVLTTAGKLVFAGDRFERPSGGRVGSVTGIMPGMKNNPLPRLDVSAEVRERPARGGACPPGGWPAETVAQRPRRL